jgi:PAS domain S-box-containing protein
LKNDADTSDKLNLLEGVIFGLADLVLVYHHKTHKVLSVKTKGVELARLKLESWVGLKLTELTEIDSTEKLIRLLKSPTDLSTCEAKDLEGDWRHINFLSPNSTSAPFVVKFFKLISEERWVMVARDLGSMAKMQQKLMDTHRSMERDYLRLRHLESRYNTLFESSIEPILIVDLTTKKVQQANSAAAKTLMLDDPKKIIGSEFVHFFDQENRDELESLLASAQTQGKVKNIRAKSIDSEVDFNLMPTLLVQEGGTQLMVRLGIKSSSTGTNLSQLTQTWFSDALEKAPYGFVVTDAAGIVLSANDEFVSLTGAFSKTQILGKPFESWLSRGGVDWGVLSNNLKQMSSLRNFATELLSSSSMTIEVEISASTLSTDERRYAFFVRDVHRLSETGPVASSSMAGSVSQLAQLVGRMPMKDIVGETSDMIEKMCIQSALVLTQNNRASAAEMLGLSRQSLYVKLHRYGMSEFTDKP